jgi:hypothetical protein
MADVKVFTIDEAYEDIVKGRGPDKKPRKRRGGAVIGKTAFWGKTSSREFRSPSQARKFIESEGYLKPKYKESKKKGRGVESFPHQFPGALYREGSIL